jgi:transposase-like protein
MAGGQRDPALERGWRERVARWSTSGLSVRAFCRQHGLVEASFYSWKRELRSRDAAMSPDVGTAPPKSASLPKTPPVFVPVTVRPEATVTVEVRCPSGHVVLLSACDVASLTSLLTALTPPERETRSC